MIDIGTALGVVGGISSIFGKGPGNRMDSVARQLEMLNGVQQRQNDLYDNTDLNKSDANAVDMIKNLSVQDAMKILSGYDAQAAGAGSSIFKSSTVKDRARNQIAYDASNTAQRYAADLETSRAQRKAALLPNASAASAGLQGALAMDQAANQNAASDNTALTQGIYGLLGSGNSSWGSIFKTKAPKKTDGSGANGLVDPSLLLGLRRPPFSG